MSTWKAQFIVPSLLNTKRIPLCLSPVTSLIILPKLSRAEHCKWDISLQPSSDPRPVSVINYSSEGHLWSLPEKAPQLLHLGSARLQKPALNPFLSCLIIFWHSWNANNQRLIRQRQVPRAFYHSVCSFEYSLYNQTAYQMKLDSLKGNESIGMSILFSHIL